MQQQIAESERNAKRADFLWTEQSERFSESREHAKSLQAEWRTWLETRGFDRSVRPDQFEVVLQAVDAARQAQKALSSAEERLDEITSYVTATEARICEVGQQCSSTISAGESSVETIDLLGRQLDQVSEAAQKQQRLEQERTVAEREVNRLARQIEEKKRAKASLMEQATATDENDFRERSAAHTSWKQLSAQIRDDELALQTIAGTAEALDEIVDELSSRGRPEVATERVEIEHRLKEIENALSTGEQGIGKLDNVLGDMSLDEKLGELLLRESSEQEQLDRAIRRWAVLAICRSLLEKAREVYERERQPNVVQAADHFLNTMVNDRYRLISALGENSLELETNSLERRHEQVWSSGLSDQVYLATRLGLACEFAKHSEPLPLIFDDVLVRFDPSRRRTAARALLEVAAQQQLLLFSCHPEVVEAIWDAMGMAEKPDVAVSYFELEHGHINEAKFSNEVAIERE